MQPPISNHLSPSEISARGITEHLINFCRVLRYLGFTIGTGQIVDALRALEIVGIREPANVYNALFSIFVTRKEQRELFAQAFQLFWKLPSVLPGKLKQPSSLMKRGDDFQLKIQRRVQEAVAIIKKTKKSQPLNQAEEKVASVVTYSPLETLRKKDFADFSMDEINSAKKLIENMQWRIKPERSLRRISDASGHLLDMRRTIRKSLRNQGEMFNLCWQGYKIHPRAVVILCDISGSMERYTRLLLHFMHSYASNRPKIEAFVFGTRLNRITHYLRQRDVGHAVSLLSQTVHDWAGGTRIGESLQQFNYLWARRVLRSSAVVMIISDGWDRGDIPLLEREIARLSRSCYRLIWLNPLSGHDDYEPLTKGMQAALPYVDDFLPIHNLASLEQLAAVLGKMVKKSVRDFGDDWVG